MRELSPLPHWLRRPRHLVGVVALAVIVGGLSLVPETAEPLAEDAEPLVISRRAHPTPPVQLARYEVTPDTLVPETPESEVPDTPEEVASEEPLAEEESGESLGSGVASYYGRELAGNRTASGERFDPNDLTAAHRTLPFGSRLRVTNSRNGASVIVRVNDRGPFTHRRVVDVSERAARELGMIRAGTARVNLELLPQTRG